MVRPSYYLVAVSNRYNLELCMKYGQAGFTNSGTGVWTFCEIQEGDYISFLYATRAYNLYRVIEKRALAFKNIKAENPWPTITFRESGRTYNFPFRLFLQPVREFNESLVRVEFAYVAENLLLRAGYRKTHFQADQTTLNNVSQMGNVWSSEILLESLVMTEHSSFVPLFARQLTEKNVPFVSPFREDILQAALKQYLIEGNHLTQFLGLLDLTSLNADTFEVLSEKAVSEGHVDLLIKEAAPIGRSNKIIIEVKLNKAKSEDLEQLKGYMSEFGTECIKGVLIAEAFPKALKQGASGNNIVLVEYKLNFDWSKPRSFDEIRNNLNLQLAD